MAACIARVLESVPYQAGALGVTGSLDNNTNAKATGDSAVRRNAGGSVDVFGLTTNNSFSAYRFEGLDLSAADVTDGGDRRVTGPSREGMGQANPTRVHR